MKAKQILAVLSSCSFASFYDDEFGDFICDSKNALTEKEILAKIKTLFKLQEKS